MYEIKFRRQFYFKQKTKNRRQIVRGFLPQDASAASPGIDLPGTKCIKNLIANVNTTKLLLGICKKLLET